MEYRHHSAHLPYASHTNPTPHIHPINARRAPLLHWDRDKDQSEWWDELSRRLANWKGPKHRSFQASDPRSVVGSFRTWDAWSLQAPSRLRSRSLVGFPFGWCSGGRGSLWRVWCVQKVPLVGRTRLTGRMQGRKEELTQSVLLPSVPTPPLNLPDRISCRRW